MLDEQRFVAVAVDPLVTPLAQRGHDRPQGAALVGEEVVVAAAAFVVGATLEDPGGDEGVESDREDVAGDPEALDEVLEAADAEERVAQDQQRPPLADDLQRLGDRAVHVGERRLPHDENLPELRDRTEVCHAAFYDATHRVGGRHRVRPDDGPACRSTDRPASSSVDLDAGWSSLVGVHGGYMCALAVRAAESMAPGREMRTMSTSFLRTGQVGPATLTVREVRQGRTITTMVAELAQDDKVLLVSRLTLMEARSGVEWSERVAARAAAAGGLRAVRAARPCRELRPVRVALRPGADAVLR